MNKKLTAIFIITLVVAAGMYFALDYKQTGGIWYSIPSKNSVELTPSPLRRRFMRSHHDGNKRQPGELVIYFNDNYSLDEASIFLDRNNLDLLENESKETSHDSRLLHPAYEFGLYSKLPTFQFAIKGNISILQCRNELDLFKARLEERQIPIYISATFDKIYVSFLDVPFNNANARHAKRLLKQYPCLSIQGWNFQESLIQNQLVMTANASYELQVPNEREIDAALAMLKNEPLINNCVFGNPTADFGECKLKRGTIGKDAEEIISDLRENLIVGQLRIENSATIRVPIGKEQMWLEQLQELLGQNGFVDYGYRTFESFDVPL